MAATAKITHRSVLSPSALTGTVDRQEFTLFSDILITPTTNTMARILLVPDDFVLASHATEPQVSLDLKDGGYPGEVLVTATPGGGAEDITVTVIERVDGADNDFALIRAIHLRAFPIVDASPSKIRALLYVGALGTDAWDRACLPVGYDSAASPNNGTSESSASLIIPRGITYSESNMLYIKIYESLNAQLALSLLGQ